MKKAIEALIILFYITTKKKYISSKIYIKLPTKKGEGSKNIKKISFMIAFDALHTRLHLFYISLPNNDYDDDDFHFWKYHKKLI